MNRALSFKHRPRKREVQKVLYSEVEKGHDATILLGPDPEENIRLVNEYISKPSNTVYGYDFKPTINSRKNIKVIRNDIVWAKPTTFIDLDLCAGLYSAKYLMYSLFQRQYNMVEQPGKERVFMVTLAHRNNNGYYYTDMIRAIEHMINRKIDYRREHTELGTEYILTRKVRDFDVRMITYSGSTGNTMMAVRIKYHRKRTWKGSIDKLK